MRPFLAIFRRTEATPQVRARGTFRTGTNGEVSGAYNVDRARSGPNGASNLDVVFAREVAAAAYAVHVQVEGPRSCVARITSKSKRGFVVTLRKASDDSPIDLDTVGVSVMVTVIG